MLSAFHKPLIILCLIAALLGMPALTADAVALGSANPADDPVFMLSRASATTTKATTRATTAATTTAPKATTAAATQTVKPPSATTAAAATTAASTGAAATSGAGTAAPSAGQTAFIDPSAATGLDINAKAYALYEVESDTFLFGRNPDAPLSPASITKVMTVLLALEKLQLSDTITITKDMYATIPNDYVRLGLTEGEVITVEQALYSSMLISANDTAMALGFKMGGSVAGFAAMMNEKAKALGCTATTFSNPYGLAETTNLTTAHDMALIMAEALKNPTFTKMATTKQLLLPATNKAGTRGLSNGNRFVSTARFSYAPYLGGKTGFTNMSGHTIVAGAGKDGRTLVGVILGATASEVRYTNLITLFDKGFAGYSTVRLDQSAFDSIRTQTVSQVESAIKNSSLRLAIADTKLTVRSAVTTTKARAAGTYEYSVGEPSTPVQTFLASLSSQPVNPQGAQLSQALEYPLYIAFKDGSKSRAGTLSVSLKQLQPTVGPSNVPVAATSGATGTTGTQAAAAANPAASLLDNPLMRILIIALAVIVLIAMALLVLNRRASNRRRRRRGNGPRRW